ncbi:MAG: Uma2 family endonuclease [Xenococcus sp. (in: cyanobacteria)]
MVKSLGINAPSSIIYPDSDGQPMADNTLQFSWIVVIKENLELQFAEAEDVFIAGDLLWYPVEGNPKLRQAPDAMVVFGRPKGYRGSYKQWEENNIAPQVVFEILSPGNRFTQMLNKFQFYENYGVEEYYLYDPYQNDLQGWLRSQEQAKLEAIESLNGWVSPRLQIKFELTTENWLIFRPDGEQFHSFVELGQLKEQEKQRAEQESQRAEEALQELKQEKQRTEQESQRAEEALQELEQEKQRVQALEAFLRAKGINYDEFG